MSPHSLLYFKVGSFKCISLSLYGIFLKLITSLVALLWIFSTSSPLAKNTGKNSRQISTFHSTGGALSFMVPFIFVNIVHIYRVSIRVRVSVRLKVSIT